MTNEFTDIYIGDGNAVQQQLQRVTAQPDFLFSAGNDFFTSSTSNWVNNATQNNNPTGSGPGIIRPPVVIVFQKMGSTFQNPNGGSEDSVQDLTLEFGTFDGSTNAPIVYPISQNGDISMAVRVCLSTGEPYFQTFQTFQWSPVSPAGTIYVVQTSTNLSAWNTLFEVTNNGSVCTYDNVNPASSARFYQLIQQ